MKTVVDRGMIAHLWFHQSQDHARVRSGNYYFRDRTIYSYGEHFPIATLVDAPPGAKVVFLTSRQYSVTTSGHISGVRRAIPAGTPIFRFLVPTDYVRAGRPDHKKALQDYRKRIAEQSELVVKAGRRNGMVKRLGELNGIVAEANRYAETFRLKTRFAADLDLASAQEIAEKEREREKAAQARRERKREADLLARQAEQAEDLQHWLRGEDVRFPYSYGNKVYLRLKPCPVDMSEDIGREVREQYREWLVETSLGAEFPVSHARAILAIVRRGVPYVHNGHTLHAGVFKVDEIDAQGNVRAGCHYVERAEIDRFAAVLEQTRAVPVALEIGLSEDTPAGIVADYLEEHGQPERAAELRSL